MWGLVVPRDIYIACDRQPLFGILVIVLIRHAPSGCGWALHSDPCHCVTSVVLLIIFCYPWPLVFEVISNAKPQILYGKGGWRGHDRGAWRGHEGGMRGA